MLGSANSVPHHGAITIYVPQRDWGFYYSHLPSPIPWMGCWSIGGATPYMCINIICHMLLKYHETSWLVHLTRDQGVVNPALSSRWGQCVVFLGKNRDYISTSLMCHLAHMQTFPLPYHLNNTVRVKYLAQEHTDQWWRPGLKHVPLDLKSCKLTIIWAMTKCKWVVYTLCWWGVKCTFIY